MDEQFAGTEDIAERGLRYTKEQFEQIMEQTEEYVRENPTRALVYAAVAGLLCSASQEMSPAPRRPMRFHR